jgi:lipopolysaccharide export system permease protein
MAADGEVQVVVASRGEQVDSEDPDIRLLVLHDGRRYEGKPGTSRFRVVEFGEHGIPYKLPSLKTPDPRPRAMKFSALLRSDNLEHIAELQWRISVPLSTLVLAFLAVPLSKSRPREGRYGRLAVGLLVFIIYLNLLSAAQAWIEQGVLSPLLGLWWVHAVMLLCAMLLLAYQNGLHKRLFR